MRNPLLPRTGIHHSLAAAWFALDCLIAAFARTSRKART